MFQLRMRTAPLALAMGLGIGLTLAAPARAAADPAPTSSADLSISLKLQDPQLGGAGGAAGNFPPLGGQVESESSTAANAVAPATKPPVVDSIAALRARELGDSPMAPLPPAIVAGPITIALAAVIAHRANRRGGRV